MPTYDYRCRDCGHTIEIVHSILEDGPTSCERCRGPLVRVLHPAGVIFKGSGFYATDSRRAPPSESASPATSGEGSGTGKPDAAKPDAGKPAATKPGGSD